MTISQPRLPGLIVVQPQFQSDLRGRFVEVWHEQRYAELGLPLRWVQDNVSWSQHGVLRGLHLQHPHGQGKLISVLRGEILDVAVDLRWGSPTFRNWEGFVLSEQNARQLYIPPGCAHGYIVRSNEALVAYKCTEFYHPEAEVTVRWDDPDLAIDWGIDYMPLLSQKDQAGMALRELIGEQLPCFYG